MKRGQVSTPFKIGGTKPKLNYLLFICINDDKIDFVFFIALVALDVYQISIHSSGTGYVKMTKYVCYVLLSNLRALLKESILSFFNSSFVMYLNLFFL